MTTFKSPIRTAWLAVAAVILAACANQMEPAKQALDGVEAAVTAASADAGKYVPEQLAGVQAQVAALKSSFDGKDYKAVIAGAPAALTAAKDLASAAAAKKDEVLKALGTQWSSLSASLPGLVAAVQSRVDVLSKSKKLPAGVDLAAAKSALADATAGWTQAQAASTGGKLDEAVQLANTVKEKATAAAAALKLQLPGA